MTRLNRRSFIQTSLAVGAVATMPLPAWAAVNDEIGIGVIGAGGRGSALAKGFHSQAGARVVAVADPDETRAKKLASSLEADNHYTDLRKLLEDDAVDAVVIATCNHWHCLAAIWAIQAGKDVYVEKPLSHNQWEGQQVVAAARKYGKVVQLGTQQRSDPLQAAAKKFLHEEKALGEIQYVQANRLGPRATIGKLDSPLKPPTEVDYDLWLGPAEDQPLYRKSFHYDWHWDWNTGNGEMGNWGVHILDDVRNVAYQDSVSTPKRILAAGGRCAWDDAGNTPNVHYCYFETETFPTLIALSNLTVKPGEKGAWQSQCGRPVGGPNVGYVIACEGGYYLGHRGGGKAVDKTGKEIESFKGGDMEGLHKKNFLDAIRSRDYKSLNAEIEVGHHSSGWCNLANVAFRTGAEYTSSGAKSIDPSFGPWRSLLKEMETQLGNYDISLSDATIKLSPVLEHDPKTEQFTGEHAAKANEYLKRAFRSGYEVPEIS